eukprot:TRINITY_DN3844_c0_g1_i2.p3 TRINITY_DN3844_c0_g1~~TRINITY_DN3844_c0_g1_i2.p3  ORF type:complete len:147 (+),score=24.12 TRINITY_DN3844_c0_g1_i2:667-1107(+)
MSPKEESDLCRWALLLAFRCSWGPRTTGEMELDVAVLRQTDTLHMLHVHTKRVMACIHELVRAYDRTCDRVREAAFGPRSAILSSERLLQQLAVELRWTPFFFARTSGIAIRGELQSKPSDFMLPPWRLPPTPRMLRFPSLTMPRR